MDQKHQMLYPSIDPNTDSSAASSAQIKSATAELGLPTEPPPTYDFAMSSSSAVQPSITQIANNGNWIATAPVVATELMLHQPHAFEPTLPVITEQPMQSQYQQQQQPMQSQYQQQQQPQQQILHHTTTVPTAIITPPPNLGPNPCKVTCPACGANKTTRMCYTPNSRTHFCALILCLVGWCCCACCVPYCMTSCRTGNHYCAKCNTFLGTFNPNQSK